MIKKEKERERENCLPEKKEKTGRKMHMYVRN